MQQILLPVFYLPPLDWFAQFLADDLEVVFEQYENFPKQTYRNRANIYGANGKLSLIVPIRHTGCRAMKDIEISYAENWQKLHWKSIKTAYQSAPYFEFYEDALASIYETKETSLLKFNLKALGIILNILKTEKAYSLNHEYLKHPACTDLRGAFSAKHETQAAFAPYWQPFSEKYGFIRNLSVVDVICNKGPESLSYIKNLS